MRDMHFTFPEFLVVLAVLGLHAALVMPNLETIREEARRSACAGNLGQIGSALAMYERDNDAFPAAKTSSESFGLLLDGGYLPVPNVLSCPSNRVDIDLDGGPESISY